MEVAFPLLGEGGLPLLPVCFPVRGEELSLPLPDKEVDFLGLGESCLPLLGDEADLVLLGEVCLLLEGDGVEVLVIACVDGMDL